MAHTLIIAVTNDRRARVYNDIGYLLDEGHEVTLATLNSDKWPDLDARVQVVQLRAAELRHPIPAIEEFLLFKGPRKAFRFARRMGSRSVTLVAQVDRAQRAWISRARRIHRTYWNPAYRPLRPWIIWRASRKEVLPVLSERGYDAIVLADAQAIPLGWHLYHDYSHPNVQFQVTRTPKRPRTSASLAGRTKGEEQP